MNRVGRWLDRGRATVNASTQSLDSLAESQNFESAMKAVELILDDDIEGAERGLENGNSAFHKLARGTLAFIRATLGFEQEVMKDASEQLGEAESSAYSSYQKSQSSARAYSSEIYRRGTEFTLIQSEAQLMQAVVGVLNESLTEALRGFYKMRKAYMALESIVQMETDFMKTKGVKSLESSRNQSSASLQSSTAPNRSSGPAPAYYQGHVPALQHSSGLRQSEVPADIKDIDDDDEDDFFEAEEIKDTNSVTKEYTGRVDLLTGPASGTGRRGLPEFRITNGRQPSSGTATPRSIASIDEGITDDADSYVFANSLDAFIHSGANLCFGMLSVMISIIPPAFSRLLSIIGFRGNRERGLRGLWQATKFQNINGGMAALCLFGYYNGLTGFCDVLPDANPDDLDNVDGYPFHRLANLLTVMRKAYPKSHLWLIEEARMSSTRRDIPRALEILSSSKKAHLKQLQSFHLFEKGLDSMYAHRYELCAESFMACCGLNSWSQALYYYIAGAAYLELYRHHGSQPDKAQKYRKQALEYFNTAPTKVGKRKMMGRPLPFDFFVTRKIEKWTARAAAKNCDLIDAIGVSPGVEMTLLWNGFKKQNGAMLEDSLRNLAWSEQQPNWAREDVDEKGILALLKAVVLRNMGKHEESKATLREGVLSYPATDFRGHKDDWPLPVAHYEMAVNLWMQRTGYQELKQRLGPGYGGPLQIGEHKAIQVDLVGDAKLVAEAKTWAEKAKGWESYTLDARFGMRITSCLDAIKKWEQQHGVAANR